MEIRALRMKGKLLLLDWRIKGGREGKKGRWKGGYGQGGGIVDLFVSGTGVECCVYTEQAGKKKPNCNHLKYNLTPFTHTNGFSSLVAPPPKNDSKHKNPHILTS